MFRPIYTRLLLLMSATILGLLGAIEVMTYVVFNRHMQNDGQDDLRNELTEAKAAVHALYLRNRSRHHGHDRGMDTLSDDTGQNVYVVVADEGEHVVLGTLSMPVRVPVLRQLAHPRGFSVIDVGDTQYRVYAAPFHYAGHSGTIYIYQMIEREIRTLEDISTILWIAGGIGGVAVVLINFWLAQRALDPARKTWQAQHEMLLELSHELRTPLATISAIANGPTASGLPDDRLLRETRHASNLVDDILYFAELQSVIEQRVEPVAVSDVTEDTIHRFEPLASTKSMTLRGHAEHGVYVTCTIERWSHLVSILCKNATQHGAANTEISWRLTATQNLVTFVIENQVGPAPKTKDGAMTGIGLRIAKRLVTDMRGQLVQSLVNGRVTSVVTVPRRNR